MAQDSALRRRPMGRAAPFTAALRRFFNFNQEATVNAPASLSGLKLKSELARFSLAENGSDPQRKLACLNSIIFLFLLIGIVGARQGAIAIKPTLPLQEIVPVVVAPTILPPQSATDKKAEADPEKNDAPQVVVALPTAPNVNFSVPTIGTLIGPASLAAAPPLEPLRTRAQIGALANTGASGDRPQPSYPEAAAQQGAQGTVDLRITGDAAGNVVSVEVKRSSGFAILDHETADFVKRHWHLPTDAGTHVFETSITYKLQLNF